MKQMFFKKGRSDFMMIMLLFITSTFAMPIFGKGQHDSIDKYPSRSVEVVVPWAPGGNSDTFARALIPIVKKYFPKPLAIVNKDGGGGTIGSTYALRAKPDGHTMLITAWGPFVTQPHLQKLQYGSSDYIPVMQIGFTSYVICVPPDAPYNTLAEFVKFAQAHPQSIKVGIPAVGSVGHLAMAQLEMENKLKLIMVPQSGGGGARVALLGRHIDIAPLDINISGDFITSGQLKALGITDTKRYPELLDVPTCTEQGFPVVGGVATHLYVPAGVPQSTLDFIHDAFTKAMDDPAFKEIAKKLKFDIDYKNSADSRKQIDAVSYDFAKVIKELGLAKN